MSMKAVQIVPMGKQILANIKIKMVKKLCFRTHKRRKGIQLRAMTETTAALNDLDKQKGPHGSASRPRRFDFLFFNNTQTCIDILLLLITGVYFVSIYLGFTV